MNTLVRWTLAALCLGESPAPQEGPAGAEAGPESYERVVRPFFEAHCLDCHGPETAKANLRLDRLAPDFTPDANRRAWTKLLDKLETGEMPPRKRPRPTPAEQDAVRAWLRRRLLEADARARVAGPAVSFRRLNRLQYETTLHDLLGIEVELKVTLPQDERALGFNTVGEALSLSAAHLEAYLEAADAALDAAIANRPRPQGIKRRTGGLETFGKGNWIRGVGRILDLEDAAVLFGTDRFSVPTDAGAFRAPEDGRYRIGLSAYAYQSKNEPVELEATATFGGSTRLLGYFEAPPEKPKVLELACRLSKNEMVFFAARKVPNAPSSRSPGTYAGRGLALQWIEVEGPLLDAWPPPSHRRLFGDLPLRAPPGSPQDLTVVSGQPRADAERLLRAFLWRAYRRPVTPEDVNPFVDLAMGHWEARRSFEDALRAAYKAILCSPHFLFLQEKRGERDEWALAARLSYFLWNSLPDEELLGLAERGVLGAPETLALQVERMLADPKARRFVRDFLAQWLDLGQIDFTMPDRKLYPEFDPQLKESMVRETELFFEELLRRDLGVANVVRSDFTFLNERLAAHYGIPGVKGAAMRRVALPADSPRGGLLTQASVLKVTANGTTTSPVTRGVWVLRNILGRPPDPPPPNAGAIEPDIRGAKTIREQLALHRRLDSCATCHVKIDPLGFALESFDVIGGWREKYRVLGGTGQAMTRDGPRVDTDSLMPDGRPVRNVGELKKVLLEDQDQLARALATKLMIYATGRDLSFADRVGIDEIVARLRLKDYGLRSLIHEVVRSRTFLNR